MSPGKILIVAGEPSGDLHASDLVRNINRVDPGIRFFGIGGGLMRSAGVETLCDIRELSVVGLVEVIWHAGAIKKAFSAVLKRVNEEAPALAILVDYPGFNLRLAKELKKRSIPVAYYISPQIWAWGADRIKTIKELVKKMIVLFKFEEEFYKKRGVNAEFAGHPLLDSVKTTSPGEAVLKRYGLSEGKPVIALLPGSRPNEIKRLLPVMLSAARLISGKLPAARFILAKFEGLPGSVYEKGLARSGLDIRTASGDTYNIVAAADFGIITSGTATLEAAIIGTPYLITYTMNPLTYAIARRIVTVKFVGLANIIAGRQVVPELLQNDATPERIAAKAIEILSDRNKLDTMRKELAEVRSSLGPPGASRRAAASILALLND